jgi:ribose transport system ATP-binding protein
VNNLTTKELPHKISFTCYEGEIIGIAGLSGSGRTELLNALFGLTALTGGRINRHTSNGPVNIKNPSGAKRSGMAYLGEDRQSMGLYSGHSVLTNMMVPGHSRGFIPLTLLDNKREKSAGTELVEALSIKCNSLNQDVDQLSGGNQQKVLIARWLHCNSDIFLFNEPTRGVDVGTKSTIYNLIFELRENRKTVLIASSEIEELMIVSSRIFVLSDRKLVREFKQGNWSEADILDSSFSEFTIQAKSAK